MLQNDFFALSASKDSVGDQLNAVGALAKIQVEQKKTHTRTHIEGQEGGEYWVTSCKWMLGD